ncbi:hypothetical protein [Paraglaciecola marina]|uniref:hypothetical protein n=1 Tax=Paraglaciecola marina TaxID=2500157 RepID=UPI001EEFC635|nr:hypothetical protein [Paraglaciecola marina]
MVARNSVAQLQTKKFWSENPEAYLDAAVFDIKSILEVPQSAPVPDDLIDKIKMGAIVATDALLDLKGELVN